MNSTPHSSGPMRIVLATANPDKILEISAILSEMSLQLFPLSRWPDYSPPEETGATLEENAILKARSAVLHTGLIAVADDTGLEVDLLEGSPGVRSARFAGDNASYKDNRLKLLDMMASVSPGKRNARFRTVVAICFPDGKCITAEGICEGIVIQQERGDGGFGYDPIFLVPDLGKTFAQMSAEEKNLISHRGKAFRQLKDLLWSVP